MLKVKDVNTRERCEIYSELKRPERPELRPSSVVIVVHIPHHSLAVLLLTLNKHIYYRDKTCFDLVTYIFSG